MKKLIIVTLLLSLLTQNISSETYTGSTSISLSYENLPKYSVKIPKTIDVSKNQTSFNYYVSGDIFADQTLQVLFDDEVSLYSANTTCKIYISQSKSIFEYSELSSDYITCSASISHDSLYSGKWIGQLNVVISLTGGA